MQLFYNPKITEKDQEIVFDREESKHISKVLRKNVGDTLKVTNGKGILFKCKITSDKLKKCTAEIKSFEEEEPKPYKLHIVVAPTKKNTRYEWFLEKATVIGVDEITPIICDHSERKVVKPKRFERILISAMKQSLRYTLPRLNPAMSFKDFIEEKNSGQLFIAHCEEDQKAPLKDSLEPAKEVIILIGPEGDFSEDEIHQALEVGYAPVSLGKTRLRTETAAIAACHTVALINE